MTTARDNQINIYLEPDQHETLAKLAARLRVNKSAVMRRALDELAERLLVPSVATERHEGPQVDRTAA